MQEEILAKLYKYCAYQDRCRSELLDKLAAYEVPEEDWEDYLAHLEAERFWDEARYASAFVRGKFYHQQWGCHKIRHALRAKGLPTSLVAQTLSAEIDEDTYRQQAARLAQQKWQTLPRTENRLKRQEKTSRYLLQKGYEWEVIRSLLDELSP